jgi:Flp pilus assembly pilin Flp
MLVAPKEKGQSIIEYTMILVLISIVVIVALTLLGPQIANVFNTIGVTLGSV